VNEEVVALPLSQWFVMPLAREWWDILKKKVAARIEAKKHSL